MSTRSTRSHPSAPLTSLEDRVTQRPQGTYHHYADYPPYLFGSTHLPSLHCTHTGGHLPTHAIVCSTCVAACSTCVAACSTCVAACSTCVAACSAPLSHMIAPSSHHGSALHQHHLAHPRHPHPPPSHLCSRSAGSPRAQEPPVRPASHRQPQLPLGIAGSVWRYGRYRPTPPHPTRHHAAPAQAHGEIHI